MKMKTNGTMKMTLAKRITRACVGLLAIATLIAPGITQAQQGPPPPPPDGGDMGFLAFGIGPGSGMGPDDAIAIVGFEGDVNGKPVTGSPFSATFTTQTTQALADGNQIQRTTTGTIARDSEGRTRRDLTLPSIGPWATSGKPAPHVIVINDVVAGTQYILNPKNKVARQVPPLRFRRHHGDREGGQHAFGRQGPPPDDAEQAGNGVVTTSLGTQTINGVQAEGTRYTRTIPTGAIGNQNPIVITTEKWYSPDLQMVVLSKRNDPRTGERVTQLTNIQRTEPEASLFEVPSDYTVKQGGPNVMLKGRRRLDQ
ncbi:MAG TPA: hypothetical protein VHX36_11960 [Candidatus Acidoferrales bacterium]|jgi:hypothetical protein|nr:hypothetical protein [Candidatus Acidoferrales bacterium]